ncbi:MAG: GxxExxY protein [Prevotella sp.]|nr:GxxExxY protein [Prevotella sp.]
MDEFKYKQLTHDIIGAAMAVHRYLGCGFSEKVYQDALEQEFIFQGISYKREQPLQVMYRDVLLKTEFIPDFICEDKVIVELKAVKEIDDIHRSQTINYAKVAGYSVALLLNFGDTSLRFERFATGEYK